MEINLKRNAKITCWNWTGEGGPTIWLSVEGMGNDRIPIVISEDEMDELRIGETRVELEIKVRRKHELED